MPNSLENYFLTYKKEQRERERERERVNNGRRILNSAGFEHRFCGVFCFFRTRFIQVALGFAIGIILATLGSALALKL